MPKEVRQYRNTHLKDARILIVEDDRAMADMLHDILVHVGYRVDVLNDGAAVLRQVRENQPDLIILDLLLPYVSGASILRAIRGSVSTRFLPVVVLSAMADQDARIEQLETGADYYLTKPYTTRELLAIVKRQLLRSLRFEVDVQSRVFSAVRKHENGTFEAQLINWLEGVYSDPALSVPQAAHELGYSIAVLQRRMKEKFGMSFNRFVMDWRLDRARIMIEHGAMNMTDVAYQNGFSSISYFITVFRHHYGIPPKKYAQQERDKREV